MNCFYHNEESNLALNKLPNSFLQKLFYMSFDVKSNVALNLTNNDEAGLVLMGSEYAYVCVNKKNEKLYVEIKTGQFGQKEDITLFSEEYNDLKITFNLKFKAPDSYQLGFNGKYNKNVFKATPGRWIGSKVGIYAKGLKDSKGNALFENFIVREK